ncbi:hypothetical protein MBLNU459_g6438t1 [Dothideomycetes sp. NU459]
MAERRLLAVSLLSESPRSTAGDFDAAPPDDAAFYSSFLANYEKSVYPVNPVISVPEVQLSIDEMHTSREARAFVYSYVAVTINLTHCEVEAGSETSAQVSYWVTETIKAREPMLPRTKVTVHKNMTAQFLHICLMRQRDKDPAFFYLRESVTLVQIMQRIDQIKSLPLPERARRQRLYSEVAVHERYFAILNSQPTVLPFPDQSPEYDPAVSQVIQDGWAQIIRLFSLVDGEFLNNWQGINADSTTVTIGWIEDKHKQIDAELAEGDANLAKLSDMQQADLIITKHWLRTLVWQMAMSKCLLSSAASKESMSLLFPVRLSSQLRSLVTKLSREAIVIHGSGIQDKLCELTDTIANVILTVPASTLEETAGRVDDFVFLTNFLFSLPRFDAVQKNLLQDKLEQLQSMFPYSANTPDSTTTLPMGAVQNSPMADDDPWLGVLKTIPELADSGDPHSQSMVRSKAPARVWQDMTRRLSLAPYSTTGPFESFTSSEPH